MVTVKTFAELQQAVMRDEPQIRLEEHAKHYYEKKTNDLIGGGVVGALPGLLVAGPIGAAVGAVAGLAIGNGGLSSDSSEREIAKFIVRYYRKSSSGINFIELTHR